MIDWTRAEELRREVGEEDFPEVVEIFLEEVDELFDRLSDAASNGTLSDDLHFLKGSAASLGFVGLSALCEAGEHACASGNASEVSVDGLRAEYLAARGIFLERFAPRAA